MPKTPQTSEENKQLKAVRRQKKKRTRMKVSGRSVIQLKRLMENKSKKK